MEQLKKKLPLIAILLSALSAVLLLCVILLPAIHVPLDTSFADDDGYRAGWNIIFYGPGMQIILGKHEFGTNIPLIIASVCPILFTLILGLMWRKAKPGKRKVICVLLGALDLYAGICFLNVCSLALTTASTPLNSSTRPMTSLIAAAPEEYYPTALTTVTAVICIIAAVALLVSFVLLLTQKKEQK